LQGAHADGLDMRLSKTKAENMNQNINTREYWDWKFTDELEKGILRQSTYSQKLISPYIDKYQTFLDVGCGSGFFIKELLARGKKCYDVFGADISEVSEKYCHKEFGVVVFRTDFNVEGWYHYVLGCELVTCFHTLEHVEVPDRFIGELYALAEKCLIVIIPLEDGEWYEHLKNYSVEDVKKLFNIYPTAKFYVSGLPSRKKREIVVIIDKEGL
jgi:2-polyprenyl-3-methyl-5-hydroxy-6-metoxy-1,4-benzoquinol methylase